jgi:chromosome segregation ATPase
MSSPAIDKFAELESRIVRTIEVVKTTRLEKEKAEKELAAARIEIVGLTRELEELKRDRDMVKARIESMLESLSDLTEGSLV